MNIGSTMSAVYGLRNQAWPAPVDSYAMKCFRSNTARMSSNPTPSTGKPSGGSGSDGAVEST